MSPLGCRLAEALNPLEVITNTSLRRLVIKFLANLESSLRSSTKASESRPACASGIPSATSHPARLATTAEMMPRMPSTFPLC